MKINKTTIVTALFDIGRDKWEDYALSYNTYLFWMKNILNFNSQMIIFTEQKYYDFILSERKKVDHELKKTIIIVEELKNIDSYKMFYEKVKNLMESEEFKKKVQFKVPEMTKPLYNTIIFNKLYFIKKCIEKKYIDTDLYVWCDAAVLREDKNLEYDRFPNLEKLNKIDCEKITFFSHEEKFNIKNQYNHLLGQYRYLHGGCFFVPNNNSIYFLIDKFEKMIEKFLELGYVGSEEKYFDFCYLENINNYNLVKSDWREYFELFK